MFGASIHTIDARVMRDAARGSQHVAGNEREARVLLLGTAVAKATAMQELPIELLQQVSGGASNTSLEDYLAANGGRIPPAQSPLERVRNEGLIRPDPVPGERSYRADDRPTRRGCVQPRDACDAYVQRYVRLVDQTAGDGKPIARHHEHRV